MKEIIFWFSSHKVRNYWLNYAISYLKAHNILNMQYSKIESWIKIADLKISFKVNNNGEKDLIGLWNINQYWVEQLFDNDFEEFFLTFIFDNLWEENDGEERD